MHHKQLLQPTGAPNRMHKECKPARKVCSQTFAGMPEAENLSDQDGRGVVAPEVKGVTKTVEVGLFFLALCLGPVRPVSPACGEKLVRTP